MNKRKSIILLSGGLDSLVCLGLCKNKYNIDLAITFVYGQKSAKKELQASKKICKYYNISNHKIIKLDWLKDITKSSLVGNSNIPKNITFSKESAKAVWVPNRNSIFVNIAAALAETGNYTHIILGANKEEGETFPDNSKIFIKRMNLLLKYSTLNKPTLVAPLINYDKNDIVRLALENKMPLDLVQSCYSETIKHCGACESCIRLKNALKSNNDTLYTKLLFND